MSGTVAAFAVYDIRLKTVTTSLNVRLKNLHKTDKQQSWRNSSFLTGEIVKQQLVWPYESNADAARIGGLIDLQYVAFNQDKFKNKTSICTVQLE